MNEEIDELNHLYEGGVYLEVLGVTDRKGLKIFFKEYLRITEYQKFGLTVPLLLIRELKHGIFQKRSLKMSGE